MLQNPAGEKTFEIHASLLSYNLLLRERVENILRPFNEAGIPVILLKGIAMLNDIYRDTNDRVLGDVDMLVKKKDFEKVKHILTSAGFSFIHGNMVNAEVYGAETPVEIYIDLHNHLMNPKSPAQKKVYDPDESGIWDNAVPVEFGGQKAYTLCIEDRIIYLCFHMLKERFSKDKWFKDLILLIREKNNEINTSKLIDTAKKYGTYKLCAFIIDYLNRSYETEIGLLKEHHPEKDFLFYGIECAIFRLMLCRFTRIIFPVRELLWILVMDSASKKLGFLKDLFLYLPGKLNPAKLKRST
ncbi:nucleotidyltransferase family protein [Candidatus Omnitrophota bacterium]